MNVEPVDMTGVVLERYPVVGICGSSGAGKTTLIEALIPRFHAMGLRVAVVKCDARNVCIDIPGKDSDRFFSAGADVSLFGDECFFRWHDRGDLASWLIGLCRTYDLILVEGHAGTPVPKIWLLHPGFSSPPETVRGKVLKVLAREQADEQSVFSYLMQRLSEQNRQTPVWGCILIGGRSRRMGRPKHLIEQGGQTWLEHAVAKLSSRVERVVLAGRGDVPGVVGDLARIPDPPDLAGPLAGILAVMRWQPDVSWLVMACDLPDVREESLQWLLDSRRPGVRAVLPDLQGDGRIEPLLAWYDSRCRKDLERIAVTGSPRISRIAGQQGIAHFRPPKDLHPSWRNVNSPDELKDSNPVTETNET